MKTQPGRTAPQDEVKIPAAISELMGTSMSFEDVGRGSIFRIRMPIRYAP